MNGNASGLSEYVVICQAKTSAQFGDDYDSLVITNAATDFGSAQVTYRTHYEPNEENFRIPRQLYAEIRGYAPSLKDAVNIFWNTANRYIPVISFSVNAHIDDLEVEIGFDNSPNLMEREFFQSVIPREIGMPKGKRIINVPLTIALLDCIAKHPERDLLLRAINQYRTALMYWKPAHETFAVSHLFMSAEALKLGVLNNYLRQSGLNIVDVAKSWGIPIKANINKAYTLKQNTIKSSVEAHLRRTIIFQNDTHCHNAAKDASDGFEHGSENYEEIYKLAVESRNQTAKYLRSAILNFGKYSRCQPLSLRKPAV